VNTQQPGTDTTARTLDADQSSTLSFAGKIERLGHDIRFVSVVTWFGHGVQDCEAIDCIGSNVPECGRV